MEGNNMPPIPNSEELKAALQEFEAKQAVKQEQKVEEDTKANELPKMVRSIMKASGGAIKDEQQAGYALMVIAAIVFVVSLYFWGVI